MRSFEGLQLLAGLASLCVLGMVHVQLEVTCDLERAASGQQHPLAGSLSVTPEKLVRQSEGTLVARAKRREGWPAVAAR